jgi:hypothetical protein
MAVLPEVDRPVRRAACEGIPLWCVLRGVWLACTCHVGDPRVADVAARAGVRRTVQSDRRASERLLDCVGRFSAEIAQAYVTEERRQRGGISAGQVQAVRDIAAGLPVDPEAVGQQLDVDFADHHLAAVITAAPSSSDITGQLSRLAAELARVVGGSPPLVVPAGPTAMWFWTSWHLPPAALTPGLRSALSPPSGVRVGLGPVARGVEGFRRSHLRAQEAERLMRQWSSSWLCDYDEIAVVSLLIKDPQEARWVVQETLGDLYNADPWLAELRETLRLYLAFGRSRARVAEEIHVSRNTVAYRVQKVSKLLKRAIDEDPLRLRLALEIARVLPVESG